MKFKDHLKVCILKVWDLCVCGFIRFIICIELEGGEAEGGRGGVE